MKEHDWSHYVSGCTSDFSPCLNESSFATGCACTGVLATGCACTGVFIFFSFETG